MICFWLLLVIALGIILGIGYVLITAEKKPSPSTIMIFFMMAICFACVPFFCAISVKNSAKYKCASPYSGMTNGKLLLTDECLEFVFWKASKEAPAAYSSKRAVYRDEDSFVYTIHSSQIKSLKIDKNHICHISGVGIVSQPEWAGTKDVREEIETKRNYKITKIILTFWQEKGNKRRTTREPTEKTASAKFAEALQKCNRSNGYGPSWTKSFTENT